MIRIALKDLLGRKLRLILTSLAIVMGVAMVWLFLRVLGEAERDEERAERYGAA